MMIDMDKVMLSLAHMQHSIWRLLFGKIIEWSYYAVLTSDETNLVESTKLDGHSDTMKTKQLLSNLRRS